MLGFRKSYGTPLNFVITVLKFEQCLVPFLAYPSCHLSVSSFFYTLPLATCD